MRLYVGNLPYNTRDDGLKDLFAQTGTVASAQVIRDKNTDRSKGFGFVDMDDEGGKAAIEKFNGFEFDGRALVVNEARPMVPREPRGQGGYNSY